MIARVFQWRELERWLPGGESSWEAAFPLVPLGDFLRRVVRPVDKSQRPLESLNVIEKISFGGKLHVRSAKKVQGYKGPLFEALPGELIISKIRVAQGSLCVVPDTLEHLAVSAEYPTYKPDPKQVRLRYLNLLLRTPNFQQLLCSSTSGNTTKKRLRPDDFEQVEIPLPEPDEQDQLLDGYEKALGKAAKLDSDALALEQRAVREFEAALGLVPPPDLPRKPQQVAWFSQIERWSHEGILDRNLLASSGKPTERYPLVTLADVVADLENGWSPQCLGRPAKADEWGVLKLGAVRFGVYDETENKALPAKLKPDPKIEVKQGDVIISRANILRLVGACAIVHATRPCLMLCDKIFRVVFFRQSNVVPEFLAEVLKTPSVRQQIEAGATGTSPTMKNISKPSLLDLVFPLPMGSDGLKIQARLIERLEKHRSQAATKRTEAARLRSQAWADFLGAIFS
jgi:type I restriction enzyme S subunit